MSLEASISALILFLPFALCFLEHGLPVAMQNILAVSYSFPGCRWIQIIIHSKMISKKLMRKKGWIRKVGRKQSFELKLLEEVKHKLKKEEKKKKKYWKCPLNVSWNIQLPKRKLRGCHLRVLWEGSTALRRWHYCCERSLVYLTQGTSCISAAIPQQERNRPWARKKPSSKNNVLGDVSQRKVKGV